MIEAIGWITLALAGGWCIFVAAFFIFGASIEGAIFSFCVGILLALLWCIAVVWMSPLSITFTTI